MNVIAGRGLMKTEEFVYIDGYQVLMSKLSIMQIDLDQINHVNAQPGQVLMYDHDGNVKWKKPFDDDSELCQKYPALEEAWGLLMEALEEYQMVKKLVQDHNK